MSLLQTIKDDALTARKKRMTVEASLLTTLTGEAAMVGKNKGNRETTDDETQAVVKKFLKSNGETLAVVTDPAVRAQYEEERAILQRYVPAELTEEELRAEISQMGDVGPKDMGRVMGALNAKYPKRVNGKLVGEILKG